MSYECYVTSKKDNDDKKDGDTEDPVEGDGDYMIRT